MTGDDADTDSDEDRDTERATVRTYVPAYQRDLWDADAEAMDMSRSEFVRTMVQAGRRGFDLREDRDDTPAVVVDFERAVRERVLAVLEAVEYATHDELHTLVAEDVETAVEDALEGLQETNRIVHSPQRGAYRLQEPTDTEGST